MFIDSRLNLKSLFTASSVTASATGSEHEDGLPRTPEKREGIREDFTALDDSAYGPISRMAINHYTEK